MRVERSLQAEGKIKSNIFEGNVPHLKKGMRIRLVLKHGKTNIFDF